MKRIMTVISASALLLAAGSPAEAGGLANARAIGMAGAYTSLARGYHCPDFNPANLGFESHRQSGLQLFGLGVSVSNNSFNLDDYNTYTGATLSENEKQDLLAKIPAEGLRLTADAEANALGLGLGNLALSVSGIAAAEVNLGRAAMELLLQGNSLADTVDLNGMYGEGYGLAALNLSYGHLLYKNGDRQLALGTTLRYLRGLGYEEVMELNGQAATLATGFEGEGSLVARTATGGSGYALDLGAALKLSRNYTVGITYHNFTSAIRWNQDTKEHSYWFAFDTLNVANMDEDSIITSEDSTAEIDPFTTHLPGSIKAGLAKTSGQLQWAIDWEQGFKRFAGTSDKPRFSAGAEWRLIGFLPLRAGMAVGGRHGTTYAAGIGFDLAVFYLDLAAANYDAISGASGKGLNFAVSSGFRF